MLNGKKSLKQRKRISPSNFTYSIQIRDQIQSSTGSFDFFEPNYSQSKKKKKETNKQNHHPILHIQISVSSKFQLQQTILIFWKEFSKKGYFWSKQKKNKTSPSNSSYSN